MTEWNDGNLVSSGEPCQTHPVIVHLELVNTVSIRNFEPCNHVSVLILHGHWCRRRKVDLRQSEEIYRIHTNF